MFLNNRHYDPTTGIFVSVDPLVAKTGQPYMYGAANPVRFSDPSGLEPGCGLTAYSTTSCGAAHAYNNAVAMYIRAVGQEINAFCSLDCGRGPEGQWYGDATFTEAETRYAEGCKTWPSCWVGVALQGAVTIGAAAAAIAAPEIIAGCVSTPTLCKTTAGSVGSAIGNVINEEPTVPGGSGYLDDLGRVVSPQKQQRHLFGTRDWYKRGQGGYFDSLGDAQRVLDSVHDGSAIILGRTRTGNLLVRVDDVVAYNNNWGSGKLNQRTNIFSVEGFANPKIVPHSPFARAANKYN